MEQEACPLCHTLSPGYFMGYHAIYYRCSHCNSIFGGSSHRPSPSEEEARYREHNNDVTDPGYRNFVKPIVDLVLSHYSTINSGLDFGAGTGPVISEMLKEKNYTIYQYDPFFHPYNDLLEKEYDYIVCCEVIEHFHNPDKEFALLYRLLKNGGRLFCKTSLFNKGIDFSKWYYKDDPTHLFFYQAETFTFIKDKYGFSEVEINDSVIILSR